MPLEIIRNALKCARMHHFHLQILKKISGEGHSPSWTICTGETLFRLHPLAAFCHSTPHFKTRMQACV